MLEQYAIVPFTKQASKRESHVQAGFGPQWLSEHYATRLLRFVEPLVRDLDETVDKRPVRTLVQAVEAIIAFRDRCNGLVLSQLGSFLDGLGRGGGTKRLSTLIHHQNWKAQQIEEFLLSQADEQLSTWQDQGQDALLIWDGTVLEKPESLAAEGLCAVRSSKAKRLTHVKKGYYHPPGMPIFVPGMHGMGLLLAGRSKQAGPPLLAALRWWTDARGAFGSCEKDENCKLLRLSTSRWGNRVLHVFDRGYATSVWLGALYGFNARFVLRWKTRSHLVDAHGVKQAVWKMARGKPGLAPRTIYDAVHHCHVEGRVLFFPVTHPDSPDWPLTVVVGRRKGGEPWYLLTNEPVQTIEDAWRVVLASARRWRIEMAFRNLKSELAIESLRVYEWEVRLKLLGLLPLAYGFLMQLMVEQEHAARDWLLAYACHRTGHHLQEVECPFSRLRIALSKLWLAFPAWFVRRGAWRL